MERLTHNVLEAIIRGPKLKARKIQGEKLRTKGVWRKWNIEGQEKASEPEWYKPFERGKDRS